MDVNWRFFASTPLLVFFLVAGWMLLLFLGLSGFWGMWAALGGSAELSSLLKPAGLLLASLVCGLLWLKAAFCLGCLKDAPPSPPDKDWDDPDEYE